MKDSSKTHTAINIYTEIARHKINNSLTITVIISSNTRSFSPES